MKNALKGLRLVLGLSILTGYTALVGCTAKPNGAGQVLSSAAAEPRLFKIDAKPGATYAYSISTSMRISDGSGEAGFEGRIEEKLLEVKGDAQIWELGFQVTDSREKGAMAGAAAGFKQLNGLQLKRHADSSGQVSKMTLGDVEVPNSGTSDLVFSKKPVKVGDTWTTTVAAQGMKIEVEYKLAGYGKHMGKDAAKIEGNYKKGQPIVNGKPLVFWVDLADGKTLHATGTFRADIQGKSLDTDFELKQL